MGYLVGSGTLSAVADTLVHLFVTPKSHLHDLFVRRFMGDFVPNLYKKAQIVKGDFRWWRLFLFFTQEWLGAAQASSVHLFLSSV